MAKNLVYGCCTSDLRYGCYTSPLMYGCYTSDLSYECCIPPQRYNECFISMTHSINYGSEVSVMYFKNESVVNL